MKKEELLKLKEYMEQIDLYLSNYRLIYDNLRSIAKLNDSAFKALSKIDGKMQVKQNHLTFMDIYNITRKIIAKIDPVYLTDYDNLLSSGELEFYYDEESIEGSYFKYKRKEKNKEINIKRQFNYSDVIDLVHEFMHYANCPIEKNACWEQLSEFFSIYFELYATKYLIEEKKIPKDEINSLCRINNWKVNTKGLYRLELPLISYCYFNDFNLDYMNRYIIKYPKEQFEYEASVLLKSFKVMNNQEVEPQKIVFSTFEYGLGNTLAFYSLFNVDKNHILKFYKEVAYAENSELSLEELLDKYHINYQNILTNIGKSANDYMALVLENKKSL